MLSSWGPELPDPRRVDLFEVVIVSESVVREETVRGACRKHQRSGLTSKRPRGAGFVCAGWSLTVKSNEGASTSNMKRLERPQQLWKNVRASESCGVDDTERTEGSLFRDAAAPSASDPPTPAAT